MPGEHALRPSSSFAECRPARQIRPCQGAICRGYLHVILGVANDYMLWLASPLECKRLRAQVLWRANRHLESEQAADIHAMSRSSRPPESGATSEEVVPRSPGDASHGGCARHGICLISLRGPLAWIGYRDGRANDSRNERKCRIVIADWNASSECGETPGILWPDWTRGTGTLCFGRRR